MPGYIITNAEVFDNEAYGEYGKLAPDAIEKFGGEFLTRGGAAEILEGDWEPHRIVVVKFDSVEQARKYVQCLNTKPRRKNVLAQRISI